LNYLPVGSQQATEFYAECALEAGVAFVNNIPVFIASDETWAKRFAEAGVPLIGDDIKAQLGATIVHRVLTDLFAKRGVKLDRTYQLNTGGNTDFLNMTNRTRLKSKKISKTEAVQSVAEHRLDDENIHIGPSDYVAWQNDNKVCFLRMEGQLFGGVPMNLELRLSVEDSPNSAGVAIDMIRCAKLAKDRGIGGPIHPASAYFCKHPPEQMTDDAAYEALEAFIAGERLMAKPFMGLRPPEISPNGDTRSSVDGRRSTLEYEAGQADRDARHRARKRSDRRQAPECSEPVRHVPGSSGQDALQREQTHSGCMDCKRSMAPSGLSSCPVSEPPTRAISTVRGTIEAMFRRPFMRLTGGAFQAASTFASGHCVTRASSLACSRDKA
jgi:hypothetical protein